MWVAQARLRPFEAFGMHWSHAGKCVRVVRAVGAPAGLTHRTSLSRAGAVGGVAAGYGSSLTPPVPPLVSADMWASFALRTGVFF